MTKTNSKSIMPLTLMSRPGTERLLFPSDASEASGRLRRSRVDTNSGYAQKIIRLLYTQYESTVSAHDIIKIHTIGPWMSFDALLEEPLNIWIWTRADMDLHWSLWWRKHGVTVTEMVVQKTGSGGSKASYSVHFSFCRFHRFHWDGRTGSTGSCCTGVKRMSFFPVWWQKCFFMTASSQLFFLFHFASMQNKFLKHFRLTFLCECDLVH